MFSDLVFFDFGKGVGLCEVCSNHFVIFHTYIMIFSILGILNEPLSLTIARNIWLVATQDMEGFPANRR